MLLKRQNDGCSFYNIGYMPNVIELLNTVELKMAFQCCSLVRNNINCCLYIQVMHDLAFLPPITETRTNFSPSLTLVYTLPLQPYISLFLTVLGLHQCLPNRIGLVYILRY